MTRLLLLATFVVALHLPVRLSEARTIPTRTCVASWYGRRHAGRKTASGVRFDPTQMVAAHRTLPLNTYIRVTCLQTQKTVVLKVIDRGPYRRGRDLDVSQAAARRLGFERAGLARVLIEPV